GPAFRRPNGESVQGQGRRIRGREALRHDELRWLPWGRRAGLGGAQPGGWTLALRWGRRRRVPVDLLRQAPRHARLWRTDVGGSHLEDRGLSPGPADPGRCPDRTVGQRDGQAGNRRQANTGTLNP